MKNFLNNYYICLDKKNRIRINLLLFLMIISSFFEMIGIGFIPLFVSILFKPEIVLTFLSNNDYLSFLLFLNIDNLLYYFIFLIVFFYLFKNIFFIFILYFEQKILLSISVSIQNKLFKSYLIQPYQEFSLLNPSIIQNNLLAEIKRNLVFFTSLLKFLRELMIVIIIFLVFILYDPFTIFTILTFLTIGSVIFYYFIKKILSTSSINFKYYSETSLKTIIETISSIREIKIFQNEYNILNFFKKQIYKKERELNFQTFVSQLPKVYLEILVITILFGIIFFIKSQYLIIEDMFIYLSFISASFLRFYPAFNILLSSLSRIKSTYLAFENLGKELLKNQKYVSQPLKPINFITQNLNFKKIQIKNIFYRYPFAEKDVLQNISLEVVKSTKIGIYGESGSGKSTLFDLISGLIIPTNGSILIDNVNINNLKINWFNYINYVSQDTFLNDTSILQNIIVNSSNTINHKKLDQCIRDSELSDFVNSLKDGLNTLVGHNGVSISGGQKQRIGIARALYSGGKILLLDEATSALDLKTEEKILNNILSKNNHLTVFIVSHRLSSLKGCDKIYQVVEGNLNLI